MERKTKTLHKKSSMETEETLTSMDTETKDMEKEIQSKVRQLGKKCNPDLMFKNLFKKALELGLSHDEIASLQSVKEIHTTDTGSVLVKYIKNTILTVILAIVITCVIYFLDWPIKSEKLATTWLTLNDLDPDNEPCLVPLYEPLSELTRPPLNCGFCRNISKVEKISNIQPETFESLYAYSAVPVIITDASKNWTAPNVFSFEFFKSLYSKGSPALENTLSECQFFPYKTNFNNLGEVFQMSDDRAKMKDGSEPWYIGWSNCEFEAANILRKHYQKPYFLPRVDNVKDPSWQAQITGTKKWTLEPPSECYFECKSRLEVTVEPGEIIVLDTNKWYHSTLNVGNDISITIGSEYD
ncbi:hypothetical protein KUTeg_019701 [Tegillarca granosa]|uniref:Cupin-like domain-containing protein n=1 Tax=Tegillarca granosa TaxID=220873 RepID=A0ABQ9EDT2_TEGGR|nr:hypothetical protein KUTeg_019701 [Tegillarca granosa]